MHTTKIVPGMVPPTPRLRRTNGHSSWFEQIVRSRPEGFGAYKRVQPEFRRGSGRIVRVSSSCSSAGYESFELVRASSSEGVETALDRIFGFFGFTGLQMRTTKRVPGRVPPKPRLRRINSRSSWYGPFVRVSSS